MEGSVKLYTAQPAAKQLEEEEEEEAGHEPVSCDLGGDLKLSFLVAN